MIKKIFLWYFEPCLQFIQNSNFSRIAYPTDCLKARGHSEQQNYFLLRQKKEHVIIENFSNFANFFTVQNFQFCRFLFPATLLFRIFSLLKNQSKKNHNKSNSWFATNFTSSEVLTPESKKPAGSFAILLGSGADCNSSYNFGFLAWTG